MKWFTGHRLLHERDGSTVVLYLNQYLTEFASESFHDKQQSYDTSIEDSAVAYIRSNIPNENIKKVKIMLGALALANINSSKLLKNTSNSNLNSTIGKVSYYTVSPSDTLAKIANLFNTTVASLKSLNNISNNRIFTGQRLKIYGEERAQYIVKPSDTLFSVASQFNVTPNHIKYVNSIIEIEVGHKLIIPRQESELLINMLPDIELSKDDEGIKVKRLQLALYLCGFYVEIDGIFNKGTESVIYKLQAKNKIRPTGKYNEHTKILITQLLLGKQIIIKNPEDSLVLVNDKYRLPFNYIPNDLIIPHVSFAEGVNSQKKLMRKDVAINLTRFIHVAKKQNIKLYVTSAYQSYTMQEQIFINYANTYSIEQADKVITKPGESEHQTGLAVDITTQDQNTEKNTEVANFIKNNAPEFGFIIRYPNEINTKTYDSLIWHIRYVGKEAAMNINSSGLTLEEYLYRAINN